MRIKRGSALIVSSVLAAVACGRDSAPRGTPVPAVSASAASSAGIAMDAGNPLFERAVLSLAPYAQAGDAPPRRTVYTWTTHEQVVALQKEAEGARLLTREESPEKGSAYLDQVLQALAKAGDPVAQLLFTSTFARMRYAWHAPFATRLGWPGEQYGDELVAVTLKENAIVLELSTATGQFSAHDLAGNPITIDAVRKAPERIAAIAFTSNAHAPAAGPLARRLPKTTYREVALCNESLIQSWSVGTDEIAKEVAANADAVDALAAYVRGLPAPLVPRSPAEVWSEQKGSTPGPLYQASLAFDNELYSMDAGALSSLAATLRATPHAVRLEHTPAFPFAGPGKVRGAPVIKLPPRPNTTFSTFGRP